MKYITLKLTPAEAKVLSIHLKQDLSFGEGGTFADETLDAVDEAEANIAQGICNKLAIEREIVIPFPNHKPIRTL